MPCAGLTGGAFPDPPAPPPSLAPPPEPPGDPVTFEPPGFPAAPPPADVIDEKIELSPLGTGVVGLLEVEPPAPTVIG